MNYNLQNKKVLITGASGGIGNSLLNKFIEEKCRIICTSSNDDNLNKLKTKYGKNCSYYFLNFSNTSDLSDEIKKITLDHDDIDILINNAGITKDNIFLRMSEDQWKEVIDVNLNSNFYLIKAILPNMIKQKSGNIIGISSVVALTGNPGQANYTASKSAIISMYKSIALEVAKRNIRVNTIAPGFIQTKMTDKLNDTQINDIMQRIPLRKMGVPDDVSNLAIFLSSNLASFITGQTFHVNGGMLMV